MKKNQQKSNDFFVCTFAVFHTGHNFKKQRVLMLYVSHQSIRYSRIWNLEYYSSSKSVLMDFFFFIDR